MKKAPKIKIGHYIITYDATNNHSPYLHFEHTTMTGIFTKISILKKDYIMWETMIEGIISIEVRIYKENKKYLNRLYDRIDNFKENIKHRDKYLASRR